MLRSAGKNTFRLGNLGSESVDQMAIPSLVSMNSEGILGQMGFFKEPPPHFYGGDSARITEAVWSHVNDGGSPGGRWKILGERNLGN